MRCTDDGRDRAILERYNSGVLMQEIADEFGLSVRGVRYVLNQMGVETNRPKGKKRVEKKPPREAVAEIPGSTWRPVNGYEGLYEVSDKGQVRSLPRKDNKGAFHKGRILRERNTPRGYKTVMLSRNGIEKQYTVHAIVASAFLGERNSGMEVNHKDANKENNSVENLEWVTRVENIKHSVANGLNLSENVIKKHIERELQKKIGGAHNADG